METQTYEQLRLEEYMPMAFAMQGPPENYCPRCGTGLIWLHSSYYCPDCTYKPGCCSGE